MKPRLPSIPQLRYRVKNATVEFKFGDRRSVWRVIGALLAIIVLSFIPDRVKV